MSRLARPLPSVLAALLLLAGGRTVLADCSAGGCIPGGGPADTDCTSEFLGTGLLLDYPPYDPAAPAPKKELRCYDGDAGCDADGELNGACTFNVNLCLADADPALPECTVSGVDAVKVKAKGADASALAAAATALLPAGSDACTDAQTVVVPLKQTKKGFKDRKATVKVTAQGTAGKDKDALRLVCVHREWQSHGFDRTNSRSSPYETKIGPDTVASLVPAWHLDLAALVGGSLNGVTATPTAGHKLLFVPSWNGVLYALKPKNGKIKWQYDTESGGIGIQGSAFVTADGRVVVADGQNGVHCLEARTGRLLWKTSIKATKDDHVWGSAQVANGRIVIGVAALADIPPAPGRLVALDLDTGAVLWERHLVPARVCSTDTTITCDVDGDCPGGGACVTGEGGGIIATVAFDPTGEVIYANTVGSFTFPSIGESDSIMRLDAATGDAAWIRRVTPTEQFGFCDAQRTLECGTDAECGADGPCTEKPVYHDFGFVNGPLLVTASDGAGGTRDLVVSGAKSGSLYALDPETGEVVWENPVVPTPHTPGFAGYGLFNGAVAHAGDRFFAALYDVPGVSEPPHLMAFSDVDGATAWSDEIGASWSHVTVVNGVLYAGTQDASEVYAYDAASGERLATFALPEEITSTGGPVVLDGRLFIPYGIGTPQGGVLAYELE